MSIDATGYHEKDFLTYRSDLVAAFQAIFGQNIQTGIGTLGGEMISIFALALSDLDAQGLTNYNAFNVDLATGDALDRLASLLGLKRQEQTRSQVTLTFVCDPNTTIPFQTLVSDINNVATFSTLQEANSGASGTVSVVAQATVDGPVPAAPNTLTNLQTPFAGFQQVNNIAAATIGEDEETDDELRARMKASVTVPSVSMLDSLMANLKQLPDVTSVKVYENVNGSADDKGIPGHSIQCIVAGGNDQDIAGMIWRKKGMGVGTFGNVTKPILDSQGTSQNVRFSRPVEVPIFIAMTVQYTDATPLGVDALTQAIKDKLVSWGLSHLGIGDAVMRYSLVCPVQNGIVGIFVESFQIGKQQGGDDDSIAIAYSEIAVIDPANIQINLVRMTQLVVGTMMPPQGGLRSNV